MAIFSVRPALCALSLLLICVLLTGCESLSGVVPTSESTTTSNSDSKEKSASNQSSPPSTSNGGQPGEMGIPNGDGSEMAGMMMGDGEMAVPDGGPDEFDSADEFSTRLGTTIPDDAPDASSGTDDYFSQPGGIGLDPNVGDGQPDEDGGTTDEYFKSFGPGLDAPGGAPGEFGESPGVPGAGPPRNAAPKPEPKPSGADSKLRPKSGGSRPASRPSQPPNAGSSKPKPRAGSSPAPGFTSQPLFRLSNPVSHFDGTGFSIGFSIDYQLLRAPEAGTTYFWVITFEELDKSGRGSMVRKVQQSFQPTDSSTLKVVVPLKGQPKEPYRCGIVAKKGNQIKQVSRPTTFPASFK